MTPPGPIPAPDRQSAGGNFRWTICALLFAATTINYLDRQILGILAPTLEKALGWNEIEYSHIIMTFQAAYALGLLFFGRWIDRIGTRRGYFAAVGAWSLAAMAHALAGGVFGFGVARFALGLGEAGNFPAAVKTVSEWFPRQERALATGWFNSGANVGAILAPLLVPWLTLRYGWQMSFVVLGASGGIWLFFWGWLYAAPTQSRRVSPGELAYITRETAEPVAGKIPWRTVLRHRQTWAFILAFAFTAPIWWFFLYWLPKFLHQQYGLDLASLGAPLVVIYTLTSVGSIGGGWCSGQLLKHGWSVNASRKATLLLCALAVLPILGVAHTANLWVATLLIGLAAAAHQGWAANLFTLVADVFPPSMIGTVVGLGVMCGSLSAMAFSQLTGIILQRTGSYGWLFIIAAGAYLVALLFIQLLIPKIEPVGFAPPNPK